MGWVSRNLSFVWVWIAARLPTDELGKLHEFEPKVKALKELSMLPTTEINLECFFPAEDIDVKMDLSRSVLESRVQQLCSLNTKARTWTEHEQHVRFTFGSVQRSHFKEFWPVATTFLRNFSHTISNYHFFSAIATTVFRNLRQSDHLLKEFQSYY